MKNQKRAIALSLLLMIAAAGCGGQSYRVPAGDGQNQGDGGWNGGGGGWWPDPNPSSVPTYPKITTSFELNGVNGNKTSYNTNEQGLQIITENVLKVTVRAGQAAPNSLNNGSSSPFTANYSCVSYLITVGGRSVRTKPLRVGSQPSPYCPDAVAEQTIDFSDRTGPGNDLSVRVTEPRYDFYCQMWYSCQMYPNNTTYTCYYSFPYSYYNSYCPTRAVYQTHTVTGELEIQVNGT